MATAHDDEPLPHAMPSTEKKKRLEITAGATRWVAEDWEAFRTSCATRDQKPSDQLRRLVRDFVTERAIALHGLNEDAFAELRDYANELGVSVQDGATRIVADFIAARRKHRPR